MSDATIAVLAITGALVLLGAIALTVGLVRRRMVRGWTRTTGRVVARSALSHVASRYPTFRWRDAQGNEHSHTSAVHSSFAPRPGTLVPVLYDPRAPHRGVIDSAVQRGTLFTVIGSVVLGAGVLVGSVGAILLTR